jgi:hypothetical protein
MRSVSLIAWFKVTPLTRWLPWGDWTEVQTLLALAVETADGFLTFSGVDEE